MKRMIPAVALACLLAACSSGRTKRVSISDDDEIMGTGIESADVEAMERFAKSLVAAIPARTGTMPVVAIHPVENNTRFDFDGELFVRRIRQKLVQHAYGKVRFVSRNEMDEAIIERERSEKRAGERTSTRQEQKAGVDFYLTGTASAISKAGRGRESDAIWIDFRLLDAETGGIVWEDSLKTKKVGKAGVIYR